MEENKIHRNLKPLLANLNRLGNFGQYLESEEFNNILLENGYDELWKRNKSLTGYFGRLEPKKTYVNCLNLLLAFWLEDKQDEKVEEKINQFLISTFSGYIEFNQEKKDFSKIIDSLKFGPNTKIAQNIIESLISKKVYENVNMNKVLVEDRKDLIEFDYAIITALEEDEMEKVLPLIEKEGEITDSEHLIEYGHLKGVPTKRVVYASQHSSGVIDAGILSAELLLRFKPKFLIMVGVLGGKPLDTNIGDVVVASKVFTIDKGKYSDLGFQKEMNVAALQSRELTKFTRQKAGIENYINENDPTRSSKIQVHFGPIATVNQVIDVEGYFEKEISSIERKAIALEMESFAVVRACQLISRHTKPLIIKSVMDNTSGKTDNAKTYAAWTSAKFLEYVLLNDII